jgi:hypothetical protein
MKRLFALYVGVILFAAGTSYANLASTYNWDTAHLYSWRNGSWVVCDPGGGANTRSYLINQGRITMAVVAAPYGRVLAPQAVSATFNLWGDSSGWVNRGTDPRFPGFTFYRSGDSRLYAMYGWSNGQHIIAIGYANRLSKPSAPPARKSRPKKTTPRELLPPVQES